MSPRKKKDPAAQQAADAAIAYAIESVADDPRGAPVVFHMEQPEPGTAPTVTASMPAVSPENPCALESAPDGAKCIVARTDEGKVVRILTPAGTQVLDKSDIFYTLPTGVKVKKVQGGVYRVYRLGISNEPMFDAPSAREAVTRYLMTA